MKKNAVMLFAVAMLLFVTACKDKGSKFIGNWKNVENKNELVIITKSGDGYTVEYRGQKTAAEYDAANDKLTATQMGTSYDLKIDEDSDDLLFNEHEFTKD